MKVDTIIDQIYFKYNPKFRIQDKQILSAPPEFALEMITMLSSLPGMSHKKVVIQNTNSFRIKNKQKWKKSYTISRNIFRTMFRFRLLQFCYFALFVDIFMLIWRVWDSQLELIIALGILVYFLATFISYKAFIFCKRKYTVKHPHIGTFEVLRDIDFIDGEYVRTPYLSITIYDNEKFYGNGFEIEFEVAFYANGSVTGPEFEYLDIFKSIFIEQ